MTRIFIAVTLVAGCSETTLPSTEPPPPWGVPVSGGTMLVTQDGAHAVIADPDRDRLLAVRLSDGTTVSEVGLEPNDEPGRLVEDGAGRIHVALRRGGAIVTLATATATELADRRAACPEPRGLAWDAANDALHVACTGGELVTLPASGGAATRTLRLDRDLRDVVVRGDQLVVTRFRTAEVLTVDATGAIAARVTPPAVPRLVIKDGPIPPPEVGSNGSPEPADPLLAPATVAWRTVAAPDGTIVMTHQRQIDSPLGISTPGGYGGGPCGGGPTESGLTVIPPGGTPIAVRPIDFGSTLPVDVAVRADGQEIAVLYAGPDLVVAVPRTTTGDPDDEPCPERGSPTQRRFPNQQLGTPTSIAYAPNGDLAVYYPELPALVIHGADASKRTIRLTGELGYDAGRAVFHRQTSAMLACASCHPEGREDGLVWEFEILGRRRTQSLAGNILARAPYHWSGDMADLGTLMTEVFAMRMGGGELDRSELLSLGPWLDRIPAAAPSPGDSAAIARGKALFESTAVGCTECHAGPVLTNSRRFDVGTGGMMKVPSLLGVAARPPFMHDGCAATLADRFDATCGGGELHGKTAHLSPAELGDLVAFLESL